MSKDIFCPMVHNGLAISVIPYSTQLRINSCCAKSDHGVDISVDSNIWDHPFFIPLIEKNKQNEWDKDCSGCQQLEEAGHLSFRNGTLNAWGKEERLSGPRRIDITFTSSCNLACRICRPYNSTFWQKHLKENNLPFSHVPVNRTGQQAIEMLKKLDLSHLRSLTFCGGETLLGNDYWEVCEYLATLPHAKESLMISFQTNGTQSIPEKRYELLEKFHLVKLHISIDGIGEKFNYQRWPGDWHQVEDNIQTIRQHAPSNVMFLIEETISIFNLLYLGEVAEWKKKNFNTNREGDLVDHTQHLAKGSYNIISSCTQEYVDAVNSKLIPAGWKEKSNMIKFLVQDIKKFDQIRNQSFEQSLPEVAELYKRYL